MTPSEIRDLVKSTKKEVFPRIKSVFVVFRYRKSDFFMSVVDFPLLAIIFVHKSVFQMNQLAIKGCILHELAHVAYPKLDERNIDRKVVELGYAKELYELVKHHDSERKAYTKEDGLTKRELKKLVKSV